MDTIEELNETIKSLQTDKKKLCAMLRRVLKTFESGSGAGDDVIVAVRRLYEQVK